MENNNTESKRINLGDVKIYEPAETDTQSVRVQLNIPFSFYLCGKRSLDEYKRICLEDVRIKASTCFELIEFLTLELREGNYHDNPEINEFINLAGVIGKGLMELTETIEMDFDRYKESQSKEEAQRKDK